MTLKVLSIILISVLIYIILGAFAIQSENICQSAHSTYHAAEPFGFTLSLTKAKCCPENNSTTGGNLDCRNKKIIYYKK